MATGIIPKAQVLGIGIKDIAATLDAFTRSGTPAVDAATRMGMAFELAASPSPKAIKALKEMGMAQYQLADDMRNKGVIPALEDLKSHLDKLGADQQTTALKDIFGGARTAGGAALMIQNLDQVKDAYNGLAGGAQNFTGYVQAQGETTAAYFNRMKASASAASIEIGNAMAPLEAEVFPMLAKALEAVVNWFTHLSPTMQTVIIAGLGLFAVLGPILIFVGSMITAIGTLITIFGVVAAAIGISGALIIGIFAALGIAVYAFIGIGDDLFNHWGETWTGLKIMFKEGANFLIGLAEGWANGWVTAANTIINALDSIHFSIPDWVPGIGGKSFGISIPTIPNITLPRLASGGIVSSPTLALIGEAGPEAVVPLNSQGGYGNVTVNINGGYYLDQQASRQFADMIAKTVGQQLKLRSI